MDPTPFVINLDNPPDLVIKHREAVTILGAKRQELEGLRDLERQVKKWQSVVDFLASQLADVDLPDEQATENGAARKSDTRGRSIGDMAVEVVNREVRKIRAIEVRDILNSEGNHGFSAEQVSNALHYAAHDAKRIQAAPGRGMYAPLAYREIELPPLSAPNGATGPTQAQPEGAMAPTDEDWRSARHPATAIVGR